MKTWRWGGINFLNLLRHHVTLRLRIQSSCFDWSLSVLVWCLLPVQSLIINKTASFFQCTLWSCPDVLVLWKVEAVGLWEVIGFSRDEIALESGWTDYSQLCCCLGLCSLFSTASGNQVWSDQDVCRGCTRDNWVKLSQWCFCRRWHYLCYLVLP